MFVNTSFFDWICLLSFESPQILFFLFSLAYISVLWPHFHFLTLVLFAFISIEAFNSPLYFVNWYKGADFISILWNVNKHEVWLVPTKCVFLVKLSIQYQYILRKKNPVFCFFYNLKLNVKFHFYSRYSSKWTKTIINKYKQKYYKNRA